MQSAELAEDEMEVAEWLGVYIIAERPLDDRGGGPLRGVELGAVELRQFVQRPPGGRDPFRAIGFGMRGEQTIERVLLGTGKVLGDRGGVRARADGVGGEAFRPRVKGGIRGAERRHRSGDEEEEQRRKFHRGGNASTESEEGAESEPGKSRPGMREVSCV